MKRTAGIHHITAIVGDPQRNIDFYAGVLGLRLVKKTINFDRPEVYHLYFGDEGGNPGTIMTFFPWPKTPKGRIGTGQVGVTNKMIQLYPAQSRHSVSNEWLQSRFSFSFGGLLHFPMY